MPNPLETLREYARSMEETEKMGDLFSSVAVTEAIHLNNSTDLVLNRVYSGVKVGEIMVMKKIVVPYNKERPFAYAKGLEEMPQEFLESVDYNIATNKKIKIAREGKRRVKRIVPNPLKEVKMEPNSIVLYLRFIDDELVYFDPYLCVKAAGMKPILKNLHTKHHATPYQPILIGIEEKPAEEEGKGPKKELAIKSSPSPREYRSKADVTKDPNLE
jgi:hypothetical protein